MSFHFQEINLLNKPKFRTKQNRQPKYISKISCPQYTKKLSKQTQIKHFKSTNLIKLKNNLKIFEKTGCQEYIRTIQKLTVPQYKQKKCSNQIIINKIKISQQFIQSLYEIIKSHNDVSPKSKFKDDIDYRQLLQSLKSSNLEINQQNLYLKLLEYIQRWFQKKDNFENQCDDSISQVQLHHEYIQNERKKNSELKSRMKLEKGAGLLDYLSNQSIFEQKQTIQLLKKALYLDFSNFSEGLAEQETDVRPHSFTLQDFQKSIQKIDLQELIKNQFQEMNEQKQQKIRLLIDWNKDLQQLIHRL